MQVSTNGLLSFEYEFTDYRACAPPCSLVPIVAPMWVDLDFSHRGHIYYRASQDTALLEEVAGMIAEVNGGLGDFHPTLAVVVTWFEARQHRVSSR